jgi:cephalosporin-C deacetylase-like acetyl esterase
MLRSIVFFLVLLSAAADGLPPSSPVPPATPASKEAAVSGDDRPFDYAADLPLDMQISSSENAPGDRAVIRQLTFASPISGRVTAYLVEPLPIEVTKKHPSLIFLHWGQGDRSEFLSEAVYYARAGAISLLLDAPWARPEPWRAAGEGDIKHPESGLTIYRQTVIDSRRAVDLLLSRPDVHPQQIAYIGHSFGATWGGALAGVEHRIKTFILIGGLSSVTDFTPTGVSSFDNMAAVIQKYFTPSEIENYRKVIEPICPINFVGRSAPSSILMQFGLFDSWISPKAAETYFKAAGEPKSTKWYAVSHEFLSIEAMYDRALWLRQEISLGPLPELAPKGLRK